MVSCMVGVCDHGQLIDDGKLLSYEYHGTPVAMVMTMV